MYRPYTNSLMDPRPFRDVASQLQELTQDFTTSFNTGNYDQAANLFAADGVLMAPLEEGAYGQKQVERLLRRMGEQGYSDLRMETIRVDHSVDMAMEIGRFSLIMRNADGTLTPERGKYVKVWKRLGAWLIMADCWSRTALTASDRAA
jgi:ketosteroid isomerase-like protein